MFVSCCLTLIRKFRNAVATGSNESTLITLMHINSQHICICKRPIPITGEGGITPVQNLSYLVAYELGVRA